MMHRPIHIKSACAKQAKIYHEYKNIKQRLHKTTVAMWYNKTYKEKHLTPNYFTIKINDKSRQSINTHKAAICYKISQEVKFLYLKKIKLNEQLYNKHLGGAATWPRFWTFIQQSIDSNLQCEMEAQYQNLSKKLDKLQQIHLQHTTSAQKPTRLVFTHH